MNFVVLFCLLEYGPLLLSWHCKLCPRFSPVFVTQEISSLTPFLISSTSFSDIFCTLYCLNTLNVELVQLLRDKNAGNSRACAGKNSLSLQCTEFLVCSALSFLVCSALSFKFAMYGVFSLQCAEILVYSALSF